MVSQLKKIITNKTFIILLIITIIRLLMSINLPIYYIKNLPIDDYLMINQADSILDGEYLGNYNNTTLIKGIVHPFFIAFCTKFNLSYPLILTILYILSCIYLTTSLNKLIKNKKWLIFLYLVLLFNPLSYSMELFQRVYRNSLSLFETLLFLGTIIRLISTKNIKSNILYYFILGIVTSIMLLTREDSIWTIITIILLIIYKLFTGNIKTFFLPIISIFIISLNLNIISKINEDYYETYTYNEISKSSFSEAYVKIQEIKDDSKKSRYSIPKSTFHKLIDLSETFDITHEQTELLYKSWGDKNGEIDNGSIIWAFRHLIYENKNFYNGKEANLYFEKLANEIEQLFKNGKLERETIIPSVLINTPTISCIKKLPSDFIKALKYISTYQNVKTTNKESLVKLKNIKWNDDHNFYYVYTINYHNTENLIKENISSFNIINIFYKYFTIILTIITPFIFIKNLKKIKEEKQYILTIIFISFFVITAGVVYTHTTAFIAIRYFYLGPAYLLQNIFIILTLEGVNYEKIKTNYFNALFKRRKNTRKLYNKCS